MQPVRIIFVFGLCGLSILSWLQDVEAVSCDNLFGKKFSLVAIVPDPVFNPEQQVKELRFEGVIWPSPNEPADKYDFYILQQITDPYRSFFRFNPSMRIVISNVTNAKDKISELVYSNFSDWLKVINSGQDIFIVSNWFIWNDFHNKLFYLWGMLNHELNQQLYQAVFIGQAELAPLHLTIQIALEPPNVISVWENYQLIRSNVIRIFGLPDGYKDFGIYQSANGKFYFTLSLPISIEINDTKPDSFINVLYLSFAIAESLRKPQTYFDWP